jgi:hypothetical protein
MSTKLTIKYKHDDDTKSGFHLYIDLFDEDFVYLEMSRVEFKACPDYVEVKIPRAWAEELGLIGKD